MEMDKFQQAEELACAAADALEHGDKPRARTLLTQAMGIDGMNAYANILLSGMTPAGDPKRLQHARDALEGAARFLGHHAINRPDQRHVLVHVDQALLDKQSEWKGQQPRKRRAKTHYKGGTDAAAIRAHERDQPFQDQWVELYMRDYLRALFTLGKELAETGRTAEATIHFRELLAMSPWDRFGGAPWLVSALIRVGLLAEAERWIEIYEEHGDTGFPSAFWTAFARGMLMVARGEGEDAVQALRDSYDMDEGTNVFHLLLTGRDPPIGGTHEIPDDNVAPINLLRAFHPTVSTTPLYKQALEAAADL